MEYALLLGVSIGIFLALGTAADAFSATAESDAMAIAAYRVAATISSTMSDVVGPGDASASREVDLPDRICGMPYVAYPSAGGREICVSVTGHVYRAPVSLRAGGVRIAGFVASVPPGHDVRFDAATRTVIIS